MPPCPKINKVKYSRKIYNLQSKTTPEAPQLYTLHIISDGSADLSFFVLRHTK